jgi:hypothetical protein
MSLNCLVIFFVMFVRPCLGYADDTIIEAKGKDGVSLGYQPFIVDRENAPLYASSKGDAEKVSSLPLGELFFGTKEETVSGRTRILIGKYGLNKKFEKVGWMDSEHLLRNREPMTVGRAVELGVLGEGIPRKSASAFSRTNALDLRIVTKPEAKLELAPYPGGPAQPGNPGFTWYYVFDSEEVNGKSYYLIGARRTLDDGEILENTEEDAAKSRLLGWVEKSRVKEWCSNIVLEYNSDEEAVSERYREGANRQPGQDASPALIYVSSNENSKVMAREPLLDFWGHHFGIATPVENKLAFFSDKGLLPNVPRFHVVEKLEENGSESYKVATLGSLDRKISASEIALKMQKLGEITNNLGKVDLVFLIDCTGSMQEEIKTVGDWLKEMVSVFEVRSKSGSGSSSLQFGGKDIEILGNMDIRVSLVGFQEIGGVKLTKPQPAFEGGFGTRVFLEGVSLEGKSEEIGRSIDQMIRSTGGVREALHDGLFDTFENRKLWREESALRLIIVIADEKGDTGGKTQADVLKVMPRIKEAGEIIEGKSSRKLFTPIYGIYTSENEFDEFEKNLSQLVELDDIEEKLEEKRFFHLPRIKEDEAERKRMIDILYGPIEKVQNRIRARAIEFAAQLYNDPKDDASKKTEAATATAMMDDIAINLAIESAGVKSIEELRMLTNVAFVEGWVHLQQKNHTHPTYRMCATLLRPEIDDLQLVMDKIAEALAKVINGGAWIKAKPDLLIAEALVTALADVSGHTQLVSDPDVLRKKATELLEKLSSEPDTTLQSLLGLKESLPISDNGLLGMPAKDILKFKLVDFNRYVKEFRQKAKCLRNVKNGETAPLDISKIEDHSAENKQWVYRHPLSQDEFIFVPVEYLP